MSRFLLTPAIFFSGAEAGVEARAVSPSDSARADDAEGRVANMFYLARSLNGKNSRYNLMLIRLGVGSLPDATMIATITSAKSYC